MEVIIMLKSCEKAHYISVIDRIVTRGGYGAI